MKIIDILIDAGHFLGLEDEIETLHNLTEETASFVLETDEKIAKLFNLVKFSVKELCSNYLPVINNVKIQTENKEYQLNQFENFIKIKNVIQNEQAVKYKILNRKIIFAEDGDYEVNYFTYPQIVSLFDEIDYLSDFCPDVIVFGLCSYFSLAYGMFEEFEHYHEEYIAKAESLKGLKNFNLPCRRWE